MSYNQINVSRIERGNKEFNRMVFLINYALICIAIIVTSFIVYNDLKTSLIKEAEKELKGSIEITESFFDYMNNQVKDGKVSPEIVKREAYDYIMRLLNKDAKGELSKSKVNLSGEFYIYVLSKDGTFYMHPYYEGKNIMDITNPEERNLYTIDYKSLEDTSIKKWKDEGRSLEYMVYSKCYEPWGWTIGCVKDIKDIYSGLLLKLRLKMIVLALIIISFGHVLYRLYYKSNLKRIGLENQFLRINFYDSLTDLPNHMLFGNYLNSAIEGAKHKNKNLCVMVLDIDKFKNINDVIGYDDADKLLKDISERIKGFIGNKGIVGRQSGDEFMILIYNAEGVEGCRKIAEDILFLVSQTYLIENHELFITASIGVSIYPEHGCNAEELIKNANTALTYAKSNGSSVLEIYSHEMNEKAHERIEMEGKLKSAIRNREFVLYYQPLVDIKSEKVIGMEALIRWNSPELGMISPAKFIPIAEETGLIIQIGEWVLYNACTQNKKWQDAGLKNMIVSVNISPRQFEQDDFVEMVERALKDTGLEPEYLELEITEDVIKNIDEAVVILNRLKKIGIKIALDDFGTGYSSLSYLRKLPIDIIKMDKSFVWEIDDSETEIAITTAVIEMGHNLKLLVLAEGVETKEQLNCLKNFKCDVIQGYYFSKPVPPHEFEEFYKRGWYINLCNA